jgi:hypothetical protein
MVQKVNITHNALVTAETIFTIKATFEGSAAKSVKTLPIIKNNGAPGG